MANTKKAKVYRCRCSEECKTSGPNKAIWIAETASGYIYDYGTWSRAMLRAVEGI